MAPPKKEPTKVIRIPVALESVIKEMIVQHKKELSVRPFKDKECLVPKKSPDVYESNVGIKPITKRQTLK